MRTRFGFPVVVLALLIGGSLLAKGLPAAASQSDVDFFRGKTVTYIVATKPGGGYDTYARLIGKYLERHLGATVVIKNVPGAGHIIGANQLYSARPDGLTIGTFNTGLIVAQLVGRQGVKFDLKKFSWIGKAASDARVIYVGAKTPFHSFQDVLGGGRPLLLGSSGVGASDYNEALMIAEAFKFPVKVITGYGGKEAELAIMRGEIDGQVQSYSSIETYIHSGQGRVLLQIADKKNADLPNVPMATDIVPAKGKKLIHLIVATSSSLQRLTAAPPGVPAGRLQALIAAYRNTLNDPGLLAEARKAQLPIDPLYGEDVSKLINEALDQPADNLILLKKIMKGK